jgi:hypothetical protein
MCFVSCLVWAMPWAARAGSARTPIVSGRTKGSWKERTCGSGEEGLGVVRAVAVLGSMGLRRKVTLVM